MTRKDAFEALEAGVWPKVGAEHVPPGRKPVGVHQTPSDLLGRRRCLDGRLGIAGPQLRDLPVAFADTQRDSRPRNSSARRSSFFALSWFLTRNISVQPTVVFNIWSLIGHSGNRAPTEPFLIRSKTSVLLNRFAVACSTVSGRRIRR
jgi:hypothetical protein